MAKYFGTVSISGPISPMDTEDSYATHREEFGQGGYRSVPTIIDRDNIPVLRRKEGMKVFVIDTKIEYILLDGITNLNWEIYNQSDNGSNNGSNPPENYRIVDTLNDLASIPMNEREKGLSVYIKEEDREYRLEGGIENTNWVLQQQNINNSPTTNHNYYYNKIGCLNKSYLIDSILGIIDNTLGEYKNDDGDIIVSIEDQNLFDLNISKTICWVGDYILFSGSTSLEQNIDTKIFISLNTSGSIEKWSLSDILNSPSNIPIVVEYRGDNLNWYGYLRFTNPGQKRLSFSQENDGIKVHNINKDILIFSPNFAILDSGSTIPNDIIETLSSPIIPKNFEILVGESSNLTISLARVNVTNKGIDNINYNIIPNTSQIFSNDGTYVLNLNNFRQTIIDSTYALVVTGIDSGVTIPPYFFGPFIINLL